MAEEVSRAPTFTVLATKSHKKKEGQSGGSLELLTFRRKQVITVLDFDDARDAIYGELDGRKGWFPASFVKVDAEVAKALATLPPAAAEASAAAAAPASAAEEEGRVVRRAHTGGAQGLASSALATKLTFAVALRSIKKVDRRGIPVAVKAVVEYIRLTAMQEPDIFRSAGNGTEVAAVRKQIEEGELSLDEHVEIHSVAVALKLFLRDLTEPLLTYDLFPSFTAALNLEDEHRRIEQFQYLVELLPPQNHNLCAYLALFWKDFVDKGQANGLSLSSAGRLFGQIFCRNNDFTIDQTELQLSYAVTEIIIGHAETLFPSSVDFNDKKIDKAREALRKKEKEIMSSYAKNEKREERKNRKKARKEKKTPSNDALSPISSSPEVHIPGHARGLSQDNSTSSPDVSLTHQQRPPNAEPHKRRFSSSGLVAGETPPPRPAPLQPRPTRQRKAAKGSPPRPAALPHCPELAAVQKQLLLFKVGFLALLALFISSHLARSLL